MKTLFCRKQNKQVNGGECINCYLAGKTGYEIHEQCRKFNLEERIAAAEGRTMKDIPPPTADEIKALAKNLYEFVQDNS